MVVEKNAFSGNPLEQFVLLAKSAKGAACIELVKQVLEAPGVYVFGELLDMPNISELALGPSKNCIATLNLFAYGTYNEYLQNKELFFELSPAQKKKLQHLTIVTLATQSKCIPYGILLKELDINNVRDLEDLIIEAIYADIIHGKLDQKNSQLEVDCAIGRDIKPDDINVVVNCLQEWCSACEGVLACVDTQIHRANNEKNRCVLRKTEIEQEIVNIKKTLKAQLEDRNEGTDEVMATDSREATASGEKGKKSSKGKGIRSSSGLKILR
ncbi:PREDICTED: COP9 signalosome complex subunit 7b isoform X2 [Nicrophorus vespilloides]|uniref:COP9 signalosome complex subunit 7b isoform X2 n=1 Tax=Nicrophorus vespilloides TaxID=110193 RepID=A0ABM1NC02_NICVS|nr:PREDICTED: COP9 signalosome complex subunit 7b isoform X2 [Nicrophorus vespilloides]